MTRKIGVFATGGTIASEGKAGEARPRRKADELIARIAHRLPDNIEVVAATDPKSGHRTSTELTPLDRYESVRRAATFIEEYGLDGVVVTHGTGVLAELCYTAELVWNLSTPIVLTGAMRRADHPEPDGPENLLHAIVVAADKTTVGFGPLFVFAGEIHAPHFLHKVHNTSRNAFSSYPMGPIGYVYDTTSSVLAQPLRRSNEELREQMTHFKGNVPLFKAYSGMGGYVIDRIIENPPDGIVIECFPGLGAIGLDVLEPVTELLARGVFVIVAGGGGGLIDDNTYAGNEMIGSFTSAGAISAGDLSGPKARLAALGLGVFRDHAQLMRAIRTLGDPVSTLEGIEISSGDR